MLENSYKNLPQYQVMPVQDYCDKNKIWWALQICYPGYRSFKNLAVCDRREEAMKIYNEKISELEKEFKNFIVR